MARYHYDAESRKDSGYNSDTIYTTFGESVWGCFEGHGTDEWTPRLKGSFDWIEDRSTDDDWWKWGEEVLFHQFIDPRWFIPPYPNRYKR